MAARHFFSTAKGSINSPTVGAEGGETEGFRATG
jgi:hypothetical protein